MICTVCGQDAKIVGALLSCTVDPDPVGMQDTPTSHDLCEACDNSLVSNGYKVKRNEETPPYVAP